MLNDMMIVRNTLILLCVVCAAGTLDRATAQETPGTVDHHRIERTSRLSGAEAERIYSRLRKEMRERYRLARIPVADKYQDWHRYSRKPYLSKAHGNRYLNNYANSDDFDFASPRAGAVYPAGTVLAKDSFTVTEDGDVFPG